MLLLLQQESWKNLSEWYYYNYSKNPGKPLRTSQEASYGYHVDWGDGDRKGAMLTGVMVIERERC